MSIFSNILRKIFPGNHPAVAGTAQGSPQQQQASTPQVQQSAPQSQVQPPQQPQQAAPATVAATPVVDVEAVLTDMAARNPQKLNWRTSIVDLMKLLDLDSSLSSRQELAQELGYTGNINDSASMNIWLHKQVMAKLAQNGGKVPEDLRQAA